LTIFLQRELGGNLITQAKVCKNNRAAYIFSIGLITRVSWDRNYTLTTYDIYTMNIIELIIGFNEFYQLGSSQGYF